MRLRLTICVLIALSGCGGGEDRTAGSRSTDAARLSAPTAAMDESPAIDILEPNDGSTVAAGDVGVVVSVRNFRVVNKLALGEGPVDGEGHIHYYLDVDEIPTAAGEDAGGRRRFDRGTYRAVGTTRYTWPDVQPGTHTLAVQLFQNGHTPLAPPVTDEVTVTIE